MSPRTTFMAAAGLALLLGGPVAAQTQASPDRDAEIAAIREELGRVAAITQKLTARLDTLEAAKAGQTPVAALPAGDPVAVADLTNRLVPRTSPDRALAGPDGFSSELSASADATTVAIKLSKTDSSAGLDTGVYTTWSATASAPLSSGARFSDLGTLDGFSNSARLRVQWSRYVRPISEPDLQPGYEDLMARVRAACLQRLGAKSTACDPQIPDSGFVHDNAPDLEAQYLSLFRMTGGKVDWSAQAYGFEGSVGYKSFKYMLAGPAREDQTERTPWGARAFYSWLPDIRSDAITGAIEYQNTYKDATQAALCPAGVAGAEVTCKIGPLGKPKRDEKLLWSLEYRHQFSNPGSFFPAVGLSTMLTYDSRNDVFGVDVPVYLVSDPKNGLTGGVRLGYRDDDDEVIVGVFVGTAFSLK
jgi:hypothetical protein